MSTAKPVPESVAIVAFFETARAAALLPPEQAARLRTVRSTGGIPANWLAEALVSRGIPTTLIGSVRAAEPMLLRSARLNVGIYRGSGGLRFVLDGRKAEREAIHLLLQATKPQLAHAMWTLEGGRAVVDWRGPKVLTVHDAAWDYARIALSPSLVGLTYTARWLANTAATLKGYRHLIAVSPFVEAYLRRQHRFQGEIRVIPNAIPEVEEERLAEARPYPKTGSVTFGCYGGPGRVKNIANAIRAFRLLQKKEPHIRMRVYGAWKAKETNELEGNGVTFCGTVLHRDFLRSLTEEVDIWVHPARIETQGITLCEALQCGCAVIAGRNSGSVAWTLDEGRSGLLVDVESPAEIAVAMHAVMLDRPGAEASIAHGRAFVRDHFSPAAVLEQHLLFYGDILESFPRADSS